jgi:trehalose/maltose transport system substrate-binding protein
MGGAPVPGTEYDKGVLVPRWNAEHPDMQVEFLYGPESATDRYGLLLQAFEAQSPDIDVMQVDVIWPGDLAEHLVDFNEYGGAEAVADDFSAIVTNNTVDGRLVGLPWFTDGGLLYWRTDLLEKYGYDAPPATWDELEEMAQTIQDGERAEGNQDFWGFVWQGKAYEGLTCDALEWVYSNGGGTIVSPDKVITINNEAAASALDRAYGWIGTISPPGVTGFQEEDSRAVFQGGNAAFMRNWPYAYSLGQADDSPVKGNIAVGALPGAEAGQSAATLGGWQMGVSQYSDNIEGAVEFAKWMTSAEIQKERALTNSNIPTKAALYEDPEIAAAYPWMPNLLPVFQSAVARPSTASAPKYNEVSTIFFSNVAQVLTGEQSGEDAVANIELDLQDLLGFETGAPQ